MCIHRDLRSKRLAPLLIQEVTRRVNLNGVFQAIYTAGIKLPHPVCTALYFHRPLNIEKLLKCGFCGPSISYYDSNLGCDQTASTIAPLSFDDISEVSDKLASFLSKYDIHPVFTEDSISHLLKTRDGVIHSYVRKNESGISDFVSFYSVPTTVLGAAETINVAYLFYYFAESKESLRSLMAECLCVCSSLGYDVFNALNIMDNWDFFRELGFISGDGSLNYYLYNWKTSSIAPKSNGFLLF